MQAGDPASVPNRGHQVTGNEGSVGDPQFIAGCVRVIRAQLRAHRNPPGQSLGFDTGEGQHPAKHVERHALTVSWPS